MIPESEAIVRLLVFGGVLVLMAGWEWLAPRKQRVTTRWRRWPGHFGLVAVNNLVVRLVAPLTTLQVAVYVESHGWGVLSLVKWPEWLEVVAAIVWLDFAIFLQHVMAHAVPFFWRLHRVHHADLDLDVTSGVRFHTLEILFSTLLKSAAIAVSGAGVWSVFLFEIVLNASAMFNHSNVAIPVGLDRWLRWLIVTPDMHRVHHSVVRRETDSNYGFNLPWWDRLLGTYRDQPEAGHDGMTVGLDDPHDDTRCGRLDWLLTNPFRQFRSQPEQPDR
ncbi:MAG: sterol desaturase family protein [Planctomycetaceae bacterium]